MTRRFLTPVLWMCLVLVVPQAMAKTSSLTAAGDESAQTDDGDDDARPSPKPAVKPATQGAPAKSKQLGQPGGKSTPRWHRFIPGMIR